METPLPQPWYCTPRFKAAALSVLALVLLVEAYLAIVVRDNDFLVHRHFGQAFLAGKPLAAGQSHYLLGRGMINALTAWLPYRVDRTVHFMAAVGLLVLTLSWWERMSGAQTQGWQSLGFAAGVFTLIVVGSYVHRDLDDCGLQLLLLFFLTAGAWSLHRGSALGCGAWLGLATAYKVTPIIFLPFLLWKRQWRPAGWLVVFALVFNMLPVLYLGWDTTMESHHWWLQFSAKCMSLPDPSQNPLEPPRHLNQGLSMAVARYLQTYPPGHPLALEHPWFVQLGKLEPAAAKRGVQLVMLTFGLVLAWRFRRRLDVSTQGLELAHEWAAVVALCAILSPLCWLQHLVLVVPCVFLWIRACLAGAVVPRWHWPVLALLTAITLGVHREFVSREWYEVLVSYKLHTLVALLAVLLVLTLREERMRAAPAIAGRLAA